MNLLPNKNTTVMNYFQYVVKFCFAVLIFDSLGKLYFFSDDFVSCTP